MISKFYPAYLKEYKNQVYLENNHGFVSFNLFPEQKQVHVMDLYIVPEYRKNGLAAELINEVCKIAKERGCDILTAWIYMNSPDKETSLLASLKYGVKILSADNVRITVGKEI